MRCISTPQIDFSPASIRFKMHPARCFTSLGLRAILSILHLAVALVAIGPAAVIGAEPAQALPRTSAKLLTIGNSFADNALTFLPAFAKAGGKQLLVFKANLGGHSLQQHAGYMQAFEANPDDPKGRPYKGLPDPGTGAKRDFSLREALESQDWDFVTIQQVSGSSYKPGTFQPHANKLIEYIRKYAPKAEILVYQTWAYPDDYYQKIPEKSLNQQTMYAGLKEAYQKLADDAGLRIIPVGDAFQAARALPAPPALNIPGDKHANAAGSYLAGATFYELIFGENVETNTFVPKDISPEQALALRKAAHDSAAKEAGRKSSPAP